MKTKLIQLTGYEQSLHDLAKRKARFHKRNESEMVAIIDEVDRLRLYEKFDEADTIQYCFRELELTHAYSYSLQAVARKTRIVPELLAAMKNGLSLSFAHKLVPQITPANQAMWIAKAMMLKQTDLEFELRAANPRKRRGLKKEPIDKAHSRMAIDVPNSTLALLIRAQELMKVPESEVLHKALDVLLEKIDPVRKADRRLQRNRAKEAANNSGEVEWENDFSAESLNAGRGLARNSDRSAEAEFLAVPNEAPLNARVLDEVNERDRGCCQKVLRDGQICGSSRWVEIHHIIDRALGGSNDLSNLTTLCSAHHRIHHRQQRVSRVWSPVVEYETMALR